MRIDDSGNVIFHAQMAGTSAEEGIFQFASGTLSRLVVMGDSTSTGETIATLFDLQVTPGGHVYTHALASGGTTAGGILVVMGPSPAWVVYQGQSVTGVGTLTRIADADANDNGDVVFVAMADNGSTVTQGLFLLSGGSITQLLAAGEDTPLGAGTAYLGFDAPVINGSKQVAFRSRVAGASA